MGIALRTHVVVRCLSEDVAFVAEVDTLVRTCPDTVITAAQRAQATASPSQRLANHRRSPTLVPAICLHFAPLLGTLIVVTVLPFTDARNRLSELIDEVQRTHERVEITRHGHAVAVLVSPDDLAALEETLEVLTSRDVMRQLADSREAVDAGDVLDAEELAALMAKRARRTEPPSGLARGE